MSTENTQNNEIVTDNDPIVSSFYQDVMASSGEPVQSTEDKDEPDQIDDTKPDAPADAEGEGQDDSGAVTDDNKPADDNKAEFNLSEFLEQSSEGFVKSEEDLKSALSKAKEYEVLQKQIEDLKAEKDNIFANETIKLENRLIKEGKTDEQIAEFKRLATMDIASLDPKEVLIQREIKNGHTRAFAERVVEREYGLDKLSFDEEVLTEDELAKNKEELAFINEKMRIDADPLRKQMQEDFKDLTTEVSPSERALKEAAAKTAYKEKLEPFAVKLQNDFPKKISIGDDSTGVLSYDVPQNFIDSVKQNAVEFFMDTEVNEESVGIFMKEMKKEFLWNNQAEILKHFKAQAEAETEKRVRAEFENPQGLPKNTEIPVVKTQSVEDELMNIARSQDY